MIVLQMDWNLIQTFPVFTSRQVWMCDCCVILSDLGTKKQPLHLLVAHGSVGIRTPPPVHFQQLSSWFQESPDGRVEGIVWHCNDGTLLKVREGGAAASVCFTE